MFSFVHANNTSTHICYIQHGNTSAFTTSLTTLWFSVFFVSEQIHYTAKSSFTFFEGIELNAFLLVHLQSCVVFLKSHSKIKNNEKFEIPFISFILFGKRP